VLLDLANSIELLYMDSYQSHLAYQALVRNVCKIGAVYECTDAELGRLVEHGVITSEERYLIFSYPCSTIYQPLNRWMRLIEILRNNRRVLSILQYFTSPGNLIPGMIEVIDIIRYEFTIHPALNRFAPHF
jgi:hypothetical protein